MAFKGFIDLRKAALAEHLSLYVALVLTKNCDIPSGKSSWALVTLWAPQKSVQFSFSLFFVEKAR